MSATTRNLTILLTDIKGFTEKTSHKSRADIAVMLEKHKELVLPVLEGKGGRLVKTIGDAFLMAYDSPTDAVLAGIAVQDVLRGFNEGKPEDERIEVRIAINVGEVTLADNDVFGDPVNITARIEGVAEAGEVFFTEAVYLAMNKTEVPSSEVGLLQLKGIPEKIRVYKVKRESPVQPVSRAVAALVGAASAAAAHGQASKAGPAPKAVVVAGGRPSLARRFGAVAIDWALCLMLVSFFTGSRTKLHITKQAGQPAQLQVEKDGQRVAVKDLNLKLSPAGVDVGTDQDDGDGGGLRGSKGMAFALVWFIYQLVLLKRLGSTVGGRICKLSVVRVDGSPLEKRDRLYRSALSVLSGYCLLLGYLWSLWERDGRGWHDLVAGTKVVETAA